MEDRSDPPESRSYPKGRRGFAAMTPERVRAIASLGGKAAHRLGVAHHWTAGEEAQDAGRKGGALSSRAGVPNRKQAS